MSTAERIGYLEQTCEYEEYLLKPMNCPHHIRDLRRAAESYGDLPLRLAEFGTVYRYEQSGQLSGMTRVRGLPRTTPTSFVLTTGAWRVSRRHGADAARARFPGPLRLQGAAVAARPESPQVPGAASDAWRRAEEDIRSVLDETAYPMKKRQAKRLSTARGQLHRPRLRRPPVAASHRSDSIACCPSGSASYVGSDDHPHRPVMIRGDPFGSLERFLGILIEHFAGEFPLWLAPEQVRSCRSLIRSPTMPRLYRTTSRGRPRASLDHRPEDRLQIRNAQNDKVPVMLVVGTRRLRIRRWLIATV